jgi:hypothetical protein
VGGRAARRSRSLFGLHSTSNRDSRIIDGVLPVRLPLFLHPPPSPPPSSVPLPSLPSCPSEQDDAGSHSILRRPPRLYERHPRLHLPPAAPRLQQQERKHRWSRPDPSGRDGDPRARCGVGVQIRPEDVFEGCECNVRSPSSLSTRPVAWTPYLGGAAAISSPSLESD